MQTKSEIAVEFNKNNTRYIGAGSYIVSLYSILEKETRYRRNFSKLPNCI